MQAGAVGFPHRVGQILVFVLLGSLTFGIIEAPSHGWTSPLILAVFSASAAALVGLLIYEPRRDEPLIDLRFFRSIPFASSVGLALAAFAAFGGFLFLNTLYLQDGRGLSPLHAGLATTPMALMSSSPHRHPAAVGRGSPPAIAGCMRPPARCPASMLTRSRASGHLRRVRRQFGFANVPITNPPCPACRVPRPASRPRLRPGQRRSAARSACVAGASRRSSARRAPIHRGRRPPGGR
jgi:hypothetical protein